MQDDPLDATGALTATGHERPDNSEPTQIEAVIALTQAPLSADNSFQATVLIDIELQAMD